MEKTHYVGKRIPRTEAYSKVTGQAVYGADVPAENAFFIKAVRSSHPHAKILTIDKSEALKIKGVITVLTSKDIPGENRTGKIKRDQPILADGKVRYNGEPIAAVVAETEAIAQEAAGKVKVDYELLRPVFSAGEALKPSAPLVHDPSNLLREFNLVKGDIEEGFSHSDLVVENWYSTPFAEHAYIEPEAGFAKMDSAGNVWVYAPSQNSHHVSREIGQLLNLPLEKVRFVQTMMGGGFGGRLTFRCMAFWR